MINQAINSVFVQKRNQFQELIHRGSRVCQGLEERHQVPEKAVPLVSRQVSPAWTVSFRMTEVLGTKQADLRRLSKAQFLAHGTRPVSSFISVKQ